MNDNDPFPPLKVKRVVGPTIRLHGGTYFDFLDPDGSEYTIRDIAHALANISRFNGHASRFYSVAQHSVLASLYVAPGFEYEALMHDAPEFVVGDVTSPLGTLLPDYKALKRRIEISVSRRFCVTYPFPPAVGAIDIRMLRTEQEQLMDAGLDVWGVTEGIEPIPVELRSWTPSYAKAMFLERYFELVGARPVGCPVTERVRDIVGRPWLATAA